MAQITFWSMKAYENPLTEIGRGRTIAAFLVAQGRTALSTTAEMRRDVLNFLMSPKAVGYWLNEKRWLRSVRKDGRIEYLLLTFPGRSECRSSLNGSAAVRTSQAYVDDWVARMRSGERMECSKEFDLE